MGSARPDAKRKTVVLLGIGHTNAHVVNKWATEPIPGCDLVCISNYATTAYSGMLPGALGRQFDDQEMRIDLRSLADRAGAQLILAETTGLDLESGEVLLKDHEPVRFDALSIGVGSMPAGWQQHQRSPRLIPIKPMQTFLARLNERLGTAAADASSSLKIAIVGGGVASVEIALCLSEQCEKRNLGERVAMEIFTSSETVADGMHPRSIRRLERLLRSRKIRVIAENRVTEVEEHEIVTGDGCRHPADVVIWATGAAAPPVLSELSLQTDERGFIATEKTLQSFSDPRIFAVGDCGTIIDSPAPKAGVYAVRQCPILWHNLAALLAGKPLRAFEPQKDFLKILNTGDGRAFLEYGWFSFHARWCWKLKMWIDRQFVRDYQQEEDR